MKPLSVFTAVVVVANVVPSTSASSAASRSNGCSDYTDIPCVCMNLQFQSDTGACSHCTAADIQDAFRFQQVCSDAGLIPSSTFTPTPTPVSFTISTAEKRQCAGSQPPDPGGPDPGPFGKKPPCGEDGFNPNRSDSSTAGTVTGISATRSTTITSAARSTTTSAAGTSLRAGAGAFIGGAILAAFFAA